MITSHFNFSGRCHLRKTANFIEVMPRKKRDGMRAFNSFVLRNDVLSEKQLSKITIKCSQFSH